jgi:thioester reductase-like protein
MDVARQPGKAAHGQPLFGISKAIHPMSKHLLLTGATGLVGQYMLRDFLLQGVPTAVLVRALEHESARDRVERVLAHWESVSGLKLSRPVCLEGDITLPGLGLGAAERQWVARHCGPVVHNAASLQLFGQDRTEEPWLSNFTGAANVLDFCREAGLRELHHVSTAYVCGRRNGLVLESELDEGQDFHNDYERCKCEAEKLIRAADFLDSLTVYRPGIIVGDSRTGYTSTYHGLYLYLRWVWLYSRAIPREADGRYYAPVRMRFRGDESCHIVPVDWVAAATVYLVQRPRFHGQTYHLTQQCPLTARELEETLSAYFNYYGPTFGGADGQSRDGWSELEEAFHAMVTPYQQYWNPDLDFDNRNLQSAAPHLPCPRIDRALLNRLIEYAIQDEWGRVRRKRAPRRAGGIRSA